MEKLFKIFYKLYMKELSDLRIGYSFNKDRIANLMKIQHGMYYINNTDVTSGDAIRIIEKFIS